LAAQVPDAPINLANNAAVTNANTIGLTWSAPVFDGGSALIDYRIFFDDATNGITFIELVSGLTDTAYTDSGLTQGLTYQFKVEARNIYGFSVYSNTVTILAAQVPAQPTPPVTTWNPDDVIITWTSPDNGGSSIIGYIVTMR
jgi:hypothetical protein